MDDDDDQSSESEFFSDKSDESLQDSSSSDDSYEEEEADDFRISRVPVGKENLCVCGRIRKKRKHLSKEVVVAKLKKNEMKCLENCSGIKLYNWRDKRNVFMISTVLEHDGSLVLSGKTNRNGEELKKPQCVLDYNNAKKGVDVSDQMTSYHTALRRSLKWYRKVAIEIITGMSVVNAHVLYNKYFADAPMSIRHFRKSLALSY
ncbi:PiggyBac transposable element-derived protein [Trinorchestia longiramus]|nr:PiggyBac transposable element-derived protein [Trinorchestia longiramus]